LSGAVSPWSQTNQLGLGQQGSEAKAEQEPGHTWPGQSQGTAGHSEATESFFIAPYPTWKCSRPDVRLSEQIVQFLWAPQLGQEVAPGDLKMGWGQVLMMDPERECGEHFSGRGLASR
jgi:hypothetical protein